jgi:hypothetical protein
VKGKTKKVSMTKDKKEGGGDEVVEKRKVKEKELFGWDRTE